MHRLDRIVLLAALGVCGLACGGGSGDEPNGGTGGTSGGGAGGNTTAGSGDFFPQQVGNVWTYRVTAPLTPVSYKVVTINSMEAPGGAGPNAGKPAFKHTTCKSAKTADACNMPPNANTNPIDTTVGWMGVVNGPKGGTIVANWQEQNYKTGTTMATEVDWWDPWRTKVDQTPEHTVLGAKWTESFKEYKKPLNTAMTTTNQMDTWAVVGVNETLSVMDLTMKMRSYPNCIHVTHTTSTGGSVKSFWYCRNIGKAKETGGQTEELVDYALK